MSEDTITHSSENNSDVDFSLILDESVLKCPEAVISPELINDILADDLNFSFVDISVENDKSEEENAYKRHSSCHFDRNGEDLKWEVCKKSELGSLKVHLRAINGGSVESEKANESSVKEEKAVKREAKQCETKSVEKQASNGKSLKLCTNELKKSSAKMKSERKAFDSNKSEQKREKRKKRGRPTIASLLLKQKTGLDKGWVPEKIVGITERYGLILHYVQWKDETKPSELIPSKQNDQF
ncbi:hypothetical protein B4U79_00565 [Dinothrombium tinctorium]|uniref:Uncharacterized protein n=1 Tax=Dinothrombium tinctorium TaxID=1965070 RepID=A0A3S3P9W3_9ACAR|nr:hypothetical protein B4U79_00565 [Dinothrombium tinctorium]